MEIIPLVRVEKRKVVSAGGSRKPYDDSLFKKIERGRKLYILDRDGVRKNKPNVTMYQWFSKTWDLWVDAGPRATGDVIDMVITGAGSLTVRTNIWPELHIPELREITESNIYVHINLFGYNQRSKKLKQMILESDGIVIFNALERIERDFKIQSFLREICSLTPTYLYLQESKEARYLENMGLAGVLMEIDHVTGDRGNVI